jgi:PQQ-dependent dehydrogenase (s-GDH family)
MMGLAAGVVLGSIVVAGQMANGTPGPESFAMRVVATDLDAWEVAWGPDDQLWVTERIARRVTRVNPQTGAKQVMASVPEAHVSVVGDGLIGMALHPDLMKGTGSDYVYVVFVYDNAPGTEVIRQHAIRRYTYDKARNALVAPVDLLTGIPATSSHLGGRLAMGKDLKLYMSVGDGGANFSFRCTQNLAQELPTAAEIAAKDFTKYHGKILRVNLDGSIPADNPVLAGVRSHVFTYGHRNPQGLTVSPDGRLYESEHGPSTDDEVNLVESGQNYGWPNVAGFKDDKSYAYGNWSKSSPQSCESLLPRSSDDIPASVPTVKETAWNGDFRPPLKSFFAVDDLAAFRKSGGGNATIAPGGLEIYTAADGLPGWANSLLVLGMTRGTMYRLKLASDGRSVAGEPIEYFKSNNRYRDIAIGPDQKTFYIITDGEGMGGTTDQATGRRTQRLANPGALLEFKAQ